MAESFLTQLRAKPGPALLIVAAGCLVVLVLVYLFVVSTVWGHTIDVNAYFGRVMEDRQVWLVDDGLLRSVSALAYLIGLLAMVAIGYARGAWIVGAVVALASGSAVAMAQVLKHFLPWQQLIPTDANFAPNLLHDTYPSGHTTLGTSLAIGLLIVVPARFRGWFGVVAGFVSATFATGVVIVGWHRGTDALGGIATAGMVMALAAAIVVALRGQTVQSDHRWSALFGSLGAAVVMFGLLIVQASRAADTSADADQAFVAEIAVLVVAAFGLTALLGWLLRSVDWTSSREHADLA